jgi:TPR repeat protein
MDTAVDLRSANDRLVDSQMVRLEWVQRKPDVRAALAPRREPSVPALVTLDPEEVATLIKRSQDFLKSGDIPSARLSLRRAANAGSAQAALALGATYDQPFLVEMGALGFAPDLAQARAWYQRARELGSNEAARRLERLAGAEK